MSYYHNNKGGDTPAKHNSSIIRSVWKDSLVKEIYGIRFDFLFVEPVSNDNNLQPVVSLLLNSDSDCCAVNCVKGLYDRQEIV